MADLNHQVKAMGNPSCKWVRVRLPLMVVELDDCPDDSAELSDEERHRIESHLGECPSCCRRLDSLKGAMSALSVAAAGYRIEPAGPSIWPDLERRIAEGNGRAARPHLLRQICPAGVRPALERLERLRDRHLAEWPLLACWHRDSCAAAVDALATRLTAWTSSAVGSSTVSRRLAPFSAGFCLAAAFALVLAIIVAPTARRSRAQAEARIATDTPPAPIPAMAVEWPDRSAGEDTPPPEGIEPATEADETVAQGEPAPAPTPETIVAADPAPASRLAGTGPGNSSNVPVPTPPAGVRPRFGFDLEHGIPMPFESRGPKSAY